MKYVNRIDHSSVFKLKWQLCRWNLECVTDMKPCQQGNMSSFQIPSLVLSGFSQAFVSASLRHWSGIQCKNKTAKNTATVKYWTNPFWWSFTGLLLKKVKAETRSINQS